MTNNVSCLLESCAKQAISLAHGRSIVLRFSRQRAQTLQTRVCLDDTDPAAANRGDALARADLPGTSRVALHRDGDLSGPVRPRAPCSPMGPHCTEERCCSTSIPIQVRGDQCPRRHFPDLAPPRLPEPRRVRAPRRLPARVGKGAGEAAVERGPAGVSPERARSVSPANARKRRTEVPPPAP
jgi:hypothetical protein